VKPSEEAMIFPGCGLRDAKAGAIFRKAAVVNCGNDRLRNGRGLAPSSNRQRTSAGKLSRHRSIRCQQSAGALTDGERLIVARSPTFFHYVKLCVQRIQPEEFYEAESVECEPVVMRLGTPGAKVR
jgi:hypothetical protein